MSASRKPIQLATIVFFLSGCSALVFETVWFRVASGVLGSSVWSAAAVLMAFMMGLGLGNAAMAFGGARVKKPFSFYVIVEILIGITGVASIFLLPIISPLVAQLMSELRESGSALHLYRFAAAFLVLFIPAIAMGATLPVLQKALHQYDQLFSSSIGRLYGWNTIGAVAGVLIAEFLLIEALGITLTGLFACGLNMLAALIIYLNFKNSPAFDNDESARFQLKGIKVLLCAPFIAGFILLALEVVWFRYIILMQTGTSTVFAVMLAVVLSGLALGGLIVTRTKAGAHAQKLLVVLPLLSMLSVVAGYGIYQYISFHMPQLLLSSQYIFALPALVLMLPVSILSGMLFPLYGEILFQRIQINTTATGMLTLVNTVGAAFGSVFATFYLLPMVGVEQSIIALALAYALLPLIVLIKVRPSIWQPGGYIAVVAVLLVAVFIFPTGSLDQTYRRLGELRNPDEKLVMIKEELNATLQYYEMPYMGEVHYHRLATNSYSMSSTDFFSRRYMKLFVYLPAALHWDIKDVLQISYGVGNTAEAVVSLKSMESFDVVDISEDILELSEIVHNASGVHPLKDKRTKAHVEDGRFFLQTTDKKYDLITGEPPPPKMAGISNLYTQEYFSLLKSRLKPGGISSYWLPVHNLHDGDSLAIIKAFCQAFPDCSLWNGGALDFILLGSNGGLKKVYQSKIDSLWSSGLGDKLSEIGMEKSGQLGALFMADSTMLNELTKNTAAVTDNYPQRISPDFSNILGYSELYAELLDIESRKRAFRDSDYIKSIFYRNTIDSSLKYFEMEGMITAQRLESLGYLKDRVPDWNTVSRLLRTSDFETVPLLWLGSDPIKAGIARRSETGLVNNNEYLQEKADLLLVERRYEEAADMFSAHMASSDVDQSDTIIRKYFFAKALAGEAGTPEFQSELKASGVDRRFSKWLQESFN